MPDQTYRVLAIDDDVLTRKLLSAMLGRQGFEVITVADYDEARRSFASKPPQVILLDWQLSDGVDGLTLIGPIASALPNVPVILLTGHSSVELAVEAMRKGAYDFLSKPVDEARLVATLIKAIEYQQLAQTIAALGASCPINGQYEGIIGQSPPMRAVYSIIEHVASTNASVMIYGESGTGKELVAQAIHRRSKRADKSMVPINMAAMPRELVESILFGHEKGAFTGADRLRIGACEQCDGGTLFLDEITEMPYELQAKLLRFAQERRFCRVGSPTIHHCDVRIISATNREPAGQVKQGNFREDLFYRLNVIPIDLPPLRDRVGDIPLLAVHSLYNLAAKYEKDFNAIEPQAMVALVRFAWPGNIRELIHTIERAIILNPGPALCLNMLPTHIRGVGELASTAEHTSSQVDQDDIVPIADMERMAIERAIGLCAGSPGRAARELGISEATIYRKIKAYSKGNGECRIENSQ